MAIGLEFGKYRIIAELGHGGMADVFLAIVCGPNGSGFLKQTVVKRLRPNLVEDLEFVTMLVDEARITARLNHPNIVQTLEVGTVGNEYFLAMEYLEGQPLHRLQKRCARLDEPLDKNLEYLILFDALAGLHHAHELADYDGSSLAIVHRDITPQNIFITYEGQTKVLDFGIAKAAGRASETRQGIIKGKVRYMSPEQATGQDIDRRADVFAIGILLWEAATGKRFWRDQDELAIVQSLVGGEYDPSPKAANPAVPDAIDAIVRRALAHQVEERYATAADLATDLEEAIGANALADARRRLGSKVTSLFAKERAQLRAIVEQAGRESSMAVNLQALSDSSTSLSSSSTGSSPSSSSKSSSSGSSSASDSDSLSPVTQRPSPFPVRFRQTNSSAPPSHRASSADWAPPTLIPPRLMGGSELDADAAEVSLLGFIPRKKRFGAGLVFGAMTMLCSVLVAILAVSTILSPPQSSGGGAGGIEAQRGPRLVETRRNEIAWAHATSRHLASSSSAADAVSTPTPTTTPAPSPSPLRFGGRVASPAPLIITSPSQPTTPVASSGGTGEPPSFRAPRVNAPPPTGPHRLRAIDTNDPWTRPDGSIAHAP